MYLFFARLSSPMVFLCSSAFSITLRGAKLSTLVTQKFTRGVHCHLSLCLCLPTDILLTHHHGCARPQAWSVAVAIDIDEDRCTETECPLCVVIQDCPSFSFICRFDFLSCFIVAHCERTKSSRSKPCESHLYIRSLSRDSQPFFWRKGSNGDGLSLRTSCEHAAENTARLR